MGWNDHISMVEMECQDCGAVDTWKYWDATALFRYGGQNRALGEKLGHHDYTKAGLCPHCGSGHGKEVDRDEF